jgi:nitrogen fixation protein NifB
MGKPDVVGIAGPGDALANFEAVKRTLSLIREAEGETTFCISTNGLLFRSMRRSLPAWGFPILR